MAKIRLTWKQMSVIKILRQYPNAIIMDDGWLTGGHGVCLDLRTVNSLKKNGIIDTWGDNRDRLSELGKTINIDIL